MPDRDLRLARVVLPARDVFRREVVGRDASRRSSPPPATSRPPAPSPSTRSRAAGPRSTLPRTTRAPSRRAGSPAGRSCPCPRATRATPRSFASSNPDAPRAIAHTASATTTLWIMGTVIPSRPMEFHRLPFDAPIERYAEQAAQLLDAYRAGDSHVLRLIHNEASAFPGPRRSNGWPATTSPKTTSATRTSASTTPSSSSRADMNSSTGPPSPPMPMP